MTKIKEYNINFDTCGLCKDVLKRLNHLAQSNQNVVFKIMKEKGIFHFVDVEVLK